MRVTINDREKLLDLPEATPFAAVMQAVNKDALTPGSAIRRIKLNGEDITGIDWSPYLGLTASEISLVAVETGDLAALARETLDSLDDFIGDLTSELERLAYLFRVGEDLKALDIFAQALDGIYIVSFTTQRVLKNLSVEPTVDYANDEASMQERINRLDEVLKAMFTAQQQQDWIKLADLVEYELNPHLENRRALLAQVRKAYDARN